MADRDLRFDIPARAYINAQLLSLLERGGTLLEAKRHLFSLAPYAGQGMDIYQYSIHDHSLAISLLFCTIVVPREFLNLPQNHRIYRDFDAENVTGLFTISAPAQIDAYSFLRGLRNSVAHALFSISESDGEVRYEFWTDRAPVLRASVAHNDLIKFMSIVGQRLTNAVLDQMRGDSAIT